MGVMLPLLQLVGTSPDCHDLSNMMESGLATSSAPADASHQVPWTCAPSGSLVSNLVFSYSGWFFILPVPAFAFCNLGGVARALAV